MNKVISLYITLLSLVLFSCKKHEEDVDLDNHVPVSLKETVDKIIVLNEGTWQQNNASLTIYDTDTDGLHDDYFVESTGRHLGDVANDMLLIDDDLFIAVNGSNTLEKINLETGVAIQKSIIHFITGIGQQPRELASSENGLLYLSNFDGTIYELNPADLSTLKTLRAGKNPEGLVVKNNRLYICNSGGLDFPHYDSTVSVIQLDPLQSVDTLVVGLNPSSIYSNSTGELFIQSNGNYDDVAPMTTVVDTETNQTTQIFESALQTTYQVGDSLFYVNATSNRIELFNLKTKEVINDNILSLSDFTLVTAIAYEPESKSLLVAEGFNYISRGKLYIYSAETKTELSNFDTGIIPSEIILKFK